MVALGSVTNASYKSSDPEANDWRLLHAPVINALASMDNYLVSSHLPSHRVSELLDRGRA